jgi:DNA-binding transcriptional regulator YhcF (GntR family)
MSKTWKNRPDGKTVRRRRVKSPPFVMLPKSMLRTPAWRELSSTARSAFVHLCARYNGANNGQIIFSVREAAAELGVSAASASRALRELDDVGFIRPTSMGRFSLKNRKASEYRLTHLRCDQTHQAASREFDQWSPTVSPVKPYSFKNDTVTPPQFHLRNCQSPKSTFHSFTGETLIESNHRVPYLEPSPLLVLYPRPSCPGPPPP